MRILPGILLLALFSVVLQACNSSPSVEELIGKEVDKRIEELKKKKRKECQEYIDWAAENLVDSVMYMEIGGSFNKTLPVPEKPSRPADSVAYQMELDTTRVTDFISDTLISGNSGTISDTISAGEKQPD